MHVVQVSGYRDPLGRGGRELLAAWPSLLVAARAAASAGVRVTVVQAAAVDERLRADGVDLHLVAERAWAQRVRRALAGAPRVARRVGELRPDLVHLHGLGFPLLARRLARLAPLLVQDHGDRPLGRGRLLQRWGLAAASSFAFTHRAQVEPFERAGVVRRGAPVHEVLESTTGFRAGDPAEARRTTGTSGDPCILWVGRLNEDKDPMVFLDGLARALPALPGARAWMAYAEAPLVDRVRRRIETDPVLAGRVALLGRQPHPAVEQLCRAADLYVSCSHREGSGYALLEALACGATPLVTDIPAYRRITRDGEVGALFPRGDAGALAAALVAWGRAPAGRERVLAHFARHLSLEAVGRELAAAYHATLEAA